MKYKIAYEYTLAGSIEIEATSLEEAKQMALELSVDNDHNEYYVDSSFFINEEVTNYLNDAHNIVC
jgi:hypothetical protein